jgi:hypothetical protein
MFSIESTHTFTVTVSSGLDAIGVCSLDPSTLEYRWASRSDAKAIQALAIGPGPVAVLTATRLGDYNFEVNVFRGGIDIGRASVQAQAAVPELVGFIDLRGALYEASNVPCCPDSSDPSAPDELRRLLVSLNRAEQDWLIRDELESLSALRDMRKIIANDHEGQAKWQALLTRIDLQVSHIEQHKVVPRNER